MNGLEVMLLLALATGLGVVAWLVGTSDRDREWSVWSQSVRDETCQRAALIAMNETGARD